MAKLDSLGSTEIESYFKNNKKFGGVLANDHFQLSNSKPDPKKFYILNIQNHNEGGSHWVLLYNGTYLDPFGMVSTTAIGKFVKRYNNEDYQAYTSTACGYFCMFFGDNICRGLDPFTGLDPNDESKNEQILQKYFSVKKSN